MMRITERRHHVRVKDWICFDYLRIEPGALHGDVENMLLNQRNPQTKEAQRFLDSMNEELATLIPALKKRDPMLAQYLDVLNTKLDYLASRTLAPTRLREQHVNLSLGGMAFRAQENLEPNAYIKLVLYTRPHGAPLLLDAVVAWSRSASTGHWWVAVKFENMTREQQDVLSLEILHAQIPAHTV